MITNDEIRRIFMDAGFTVKEGQSDLKPYVFDAAHDLIELVKDRAVAICDALESRYADSAASRYEDGLYDAAMTIGARIRANV